MYVCSRTRKQSKRKARKWNDEETNFFDRSIVTKCMQVQQAYLEKIVMIRCRKSVFYFSKLILRIPCELFIISDFRKRGYNYLVSEIKSCLLLSRNEN